MLPFAATPALRIAHFTGGRHGSARFSLASTAPAMWAVADVNQYFCSQFNTICRFRDPAMR